ncbi:aminotransferase class V-fold PLP-dependent enzyme [Paraburkholderia fungorum]|uniref:aminotransferase class V-fold PLP-dependent enzyme n=1 Tax=Paraburkholderia fungorum TaxID=134537 RepID=UPI0038BBCFE1
MQSNTPQTPGTHDGWLMYHSVGLFPDQETAVRDALAQFASSWCAPGLKRWDEGLAARQRVLDDWAHLVNADTRNVFAAENVTEAFGKFVAALGPQLKGRKVLIAADCFPSLHFLLAGLAVTFGFTLATVPLAAGASWVTDEAFIDAWRDDVALAVITWVTSTASKRAELDRLVAHGRKQGSLIAVDITQGAGILDFDVTAPAVDFVATTTLKWLCGAPGTGLGYVCPALLDSGLAPQMTGWFSQPDPFNWDITRFSLAAEARRFDTGTPSFLPFVASAPGLAWRLSEAAVGLRDYNLRVCHALIETLDAKGYALHSPRADEARGGSVMATLPAHVDPKALEASLVEAGVVVDTRGRVMRFSPGVLTHDSVASRLATLLPD